MIVLNISREFCWPKGRLPRKTVEMILCLPTLVLAQCTVHKCIIFQKRKRKKCVSLRWESVSFISSHFFSLKHFSVSKLTVNVYRDLQVLYRKIRVLLGIWNQRKNDTNCSESDVNLEKPHIQSQEYNIVLIWLLLYTRHQRKPNNKIEMNFYISSPVL